MGLIHLHKPDQVNMITEGFFLNLCGHSLTSGKSFGIKAPILSCFKNIFG